MKPFISILLGSLLLCVQLAQADDAGASALKQEAFLRVKAQMLEADKGSLEAMQQAHDCIEAASNPVQLRECHDARQVKMAELREQARSRFEMHRAQRMQNHASHQPQPSPRQ